MHNQTRSISTRSEAQALHLIAASLLVVFSSSIAYSQTAFSVIYTFTGGNDGGQPTSGPLLQDNAGVLYGNTAFFGAHAKGVETLASCFKLSPSGEETVVHNFTLGDISSNPSSGLIGDSSGNLSGTTFQPGSVYQINSSGSFSQFASFDSLNGFDPMSNLLQDAAGNLYGTTYEGGRGV